MACIRTFFVALLAAAAVGAFPSSVASSKSPNYIRSNPPSGDYPWGTHTKRSSYPPYTGVTRFYNFNIARSTQSPDGVQKSLILVNGQFPGPAIQANYGDWIEVRVTNSITGPTEGTALHWHGLLQSESQWADGVPGISQCPIAPGASFTYRFRADVYGTTWYHAHYSGQYTDGASGPLTIYGPSHVDYDIDLGTIMLADWYHQSYEDIVQRVSGNNSTLWAVPYSNTLINGKNPYNCSLVTDGTPCTSSAAMSTFRFKAGKTHLLRLVNSGGNGLIRFALDGHQMTVVTTDFTPIVPYNTSVVTLEIGQRADILVTATGNINSAYWMRANQTGIPCSRTGPLSQPEGLAVVLYDHAPSNAIPTSCSPIIPAPPTFQIGPVTLGTCQTDPLDLLVPYYPQAVDLNPTVTYTVLVNETVNATGNQIFTMNSQSFHADYNEPLLLAANSGASTFNAGSNIYNLGNASQVRVILYNIGVNPHPMHLHGHEFFVLAEGTGTWDGNITNPSSPARRDTVQLSAAAYAVIQFEASNPGVWPLHCHIGIHLSMGLSLNFLEQPAVLEQLPIQYLMPQTCAAWAAYSKQNTVDEIDSGI